MKFSGQADKCSNTLLCSFVALLNFTDKETDVYFCTALHWTTVQFSTLHYTVLHCNALHCNAAWYEGWGDLGSFGLKLSSPPDGMPRATGCTLNTEHCTLYIAQCTLYNIHYTLYTVHYILYIVHPSTLYSTQRAVYSRRSNIIFFSWFM